MEKIRKKIISFIKKQARNKSVVIGLSGGLDSSVLAYLATEALGKNNIYGLLMPSSTNRKEDVKFAELVANFLEIRHETINLDEIINDFQKTGYFKNRKSLGNLKARIRMSLLYGIANETNSLVLGTGNKSEIMVGYFTKYGDSGADLLPLGGLYKTQIKKIALLINVPIAIIDRAPTAGLWEGQTDEAELGITYEKLDKILLAMENKKNIKNFNKSEVELVKNYIINSEHKRKLPPICKI